MILGSGRRRALAGLAILAMAAVGVFLMMGLHRAGYPRLVSVTPPHVRRTCNPPSTGSFPGKPGRECFLFLTLDTRFTTRIAPLDVMNWDPLDLRLGPPGTHIVAGFSPTGARDVGGTELTLFTLSLYLTVAWRAP